jgi:hypothetical protein
MLSKPLATHPSKAQASCLCKTYTQKPREGRDLECSGPPDSLGGSWDERKAPTGHWGKHTKEISEFEKKKEKKV